MNILAIDTSAQVSSVCLLDEEQILAEFNVNVRLTHSQTLMPMVEAALRCSGYTLSQADIFAVSVGPGSFTGIRIGVSAIKGLALPENKPCVAVSTLEAMAYNLGILDGVLCCVMDARCQQVYNALFRAKDGVITRMCADRALSVKDLERDLGNLHENIFLVGDGADLCYNKINNQAGFIHLAPKHLKLQKAASVGLCAQQKISRNEIVSAADLIPQYLRLPQAERELLKKQRESSPRGKGSGITNVSNRK